MPKSKVRKKVATESASSASRANTSAAVAARLGVAKPSSPAYIGVMVGLMVLGLLWLIINYLWGQDIPGMKELGSWNFLVGFGLLVVGLIMTMRWR